MLLFGGKGGVGKTTCSAAVAAQCASMGVRTLILTSDMAPSLSDIFETRISGKPSAISENLFAAELSQETIVQRWKEKFGGDFQDIVSNLIDVDALDAESRHQILDYIGSAPSLREETMLDLIVDMAEGGRYGLVIWDTAPAGETLNLIDMPRKIRKHLTAGARVFEGLDKIGKGLTGRRPVSHIMDNWIAVSERISKFVHQRARFIIVTNPEGLVIKQTKRTLATLKEYNIRLHGMVINRVMGSGPAEEEHLQELIKMAGGLPVSVLPYSIGEIKGIKSLRELGGTLVRDLGILDT